MLCLLEREWARFHCNAAAWPPFLSPTVEFEGRLEPAHLQVRLKLGLVSPGNWGGLLQEAGHFHECALALEHG